MTETTSTATAETETARKAVACALKLGNRAKRSLYAGDPSCALDELTRSEKALRGASKHVGAHDYALAAALECAAKKSRAARDAIRTGGGSYAIELVDATLGHTRRAAGYLAA